MTQRILVVEDEPSIADTITFALKSEGFAPAWCATANEARALLAGDEYALAILDVGLPDGNGFDLCKELRKVSSMPVIFLTARAAEIDRVVGLEIGADDYMVKPFSPRELSARVKAVLRRTTALPAVTAPSPSEHSAAGPFVVDREKVVISYEGSPLELSRYEFKILDTLLSRPGQVFSRRQLMEAVWDEPDVSMERTVDTHVKTIRRKLEAVKPGADVIETRRGFGYALVSPAS
jgi:two-component system, OmpR family, catabolic regulation response regulator CreB